MCCALKRTKESPRVIFISGFSNSGKTTLIERLIPRLRRLGLRVGTIKHAHEGFEPDRPGKDSWRHAQAGACAVTLIAPKQVASFIQTEQETPLAPILHQMASRADLVLVEGFKQVPGPRILVEPNGLSRLKIEHSICHVGVFPKRLSASELTKITQFCRGKDGDN